MLGLALYNREVPGASSLLILREKGDAVFPRLLRRWFPRLLRRRFPRLLPRLFPWLTVLLNLVLLSAPAYGNQALITIDGVFSDWDGIVPAYIDASGDDGPSGIDLGALWLADDPRFFFLRFEVGPEASLDEGNDLVLYLDTDSNGSTGLSVGGIGAELEWRLGQRAGTVYLGGGTTSISHDEIRFRGQPTVTSPVYEVAVGRDTLPDGQNPLFSGAPVQVLIIDEQGGGDRLPGLGQDLSYTLDQGALPPESDIPLDRAQAGDLRLATYNVLNDSPWDPGDEPRFGRQLAAVNADIYNFQEIYNHSDQEVAELVESWVPLGAGESWSAIGNNDCRTVSRFPILESWTLSGNLAVHIDTQSTLGRELLIINAHLPCCANDTGRQAEIDEILAFLRDAQNPGGAIHLSSDTAIFITGDLNLVNLSQQLTSLLTGDIVNEGTHGPDFDPDWDGSFLTNVVPRQTEKRMGYTWRNDNSSFWPGHLDYVIYTDSVVELARQYVLYTPEMSATVLSQYGLQASDSEASDHIIFCTDFRPAATGPLFMRGNCNADGGFNITDAVYALGALFGSLGSVPCEAACDGNGDELFDVADPIYCLSYLFAQGPPPPSPFPSCGANPVGLECDEFRACP